MKRLRRILLAIAPILLLGCNSPFGTDGEDFVLKVVPAKESYAADEEVAVRLENRSGEDLGYGACALSLEQREESTWRSLAPEPLFCIGILYVVGPGGHVDLEADLSKLEPGVYRYRIELLPGTHMPLIAIRSRSFRILP